MVFKQRILLDRRHVPHGLKADSALNNPSRQITMSLLRKLFERQKIRSATITLIGPPKAGKTTFVRYIETGKSVLEDISTTLGIEIRRNKVEIDGWRLSAIDTGGQQLYQQTFWELAVQQANAVIFVIDSTVREETNPELYSLTREQFSYALDIITESIPLLILLNKQDLKEMNPMSPQEAFEIFRNLPLHNRTLAYIPCSAKYGDGVEDALRWLVEKLQ